jgi:hypothetical protein
VIVFTHSSAVIHKGNILRVRKRKCVLAQAAAVLYVTKRSRLKPSRKMWMKNWKMEEDAFSHLPLLQELRENNPNDCKNYLRMDSETFDDLLSLVEPHITKKDTVMRKSIQAEERLIATLRFLATGRSYEDLNFSTGISAPGLCKIIPETCKALFEVLKKDYMKVSVKKYFFITVQKCLRQTNIPLYYNN